LTLERAIGKWQKGEFLPYRAGGGHHPGEPAADQRPTLDGQLSLDLVFGCRVAGPTGLAKLAFVLEGRPEHGRGHGVGSGIGG
jgi:hypothetical protein